MPLCCIQRLRVLVRRFRSRYYLVQRAKEAGVFGIVVGTLGVQRYGSVVRALRKMIEDAGRKAYTLAVGKVNVAKLANFAEVKQSWTINSLSASAGFLGVNGVAFFVFVRPMCCITFAAPFASRVCTRFGD